MPPLKKTSIARRKGQTNARKAIDTAKKHGLPHVTRMGKPVRSVATVDSVRNRERIQTFAKRRKARAAKSQFTPVGKLKMEDF